VLCTDSGPSKPRQLLKGMKTPSALLELLPSQEQHRH